MCSFSVVRLWIISKQIYMHVSIAMKQVLALLMRTKVVVLLVLNIMSLRKVKLTLAWLVERVVGLANRSQ
ncbi:hypothetical protein VIBNISFn135_960004 [Vibrio nigripulchritudo SFn135]|nr:hypothetical protein VIBNISFn135_960004 [Vibrio nigripulchritudo SFn135]